MIELTEIQADKGMIELTEIQADKGGAMSVLHMPRSTHTHLDGISSKHALISGIYSDQNRVQAMVTVRCSKFGPLSRF